MFEAPVRWRKCTTDKTHYFYNTSIIFANSNHLSFSLPLAHTFFLFFSLTHFLSLSPSHSQCLIELSIFPQYVLTMYWSFEFPFNSMSNQSVWKANCSFNISPPFCILHFHQCSLAIFLNFTSVLTLKQCLQTVVCWPLRDPGDSPRWQVEALTTFHVQPTGR